MTAPNVGNISMTLFPFCKKITISETVRRRSKFTVGHDQEVGIALSDCDNTNFVQCFLVAKLAFRYFQYERKPQYLRICYWWRGHVKWVVVYLAVSLPLHRRLRVNYAPDASPLCDMQSHCTTATQTPFGVLQCACTVAK